MALDPMDLDPMELDPMELDPMDLDPMDFGPDGFGPDGLGANGSRTTDLGPGDPLTDWGRVPRCYFDRFGEICSLNAN